MSEIDYYDRDSAFVVVPECRCVEERDTSIWVESPHFPNDTPFGAARVWFPKGKHIHDDSEVFEEGDEGDLIISEWIANEKGLL